MPTLMKYDNDGAQNAKIIWYRKDEVPLPIVTDAALREALADIEAANYAEAYSRESRKFGYESTEDVGYAGRIRNLARKLWSKPGNL